MKAIATSVVLVALALTPISADAKGCIKGAIVGGIAGHYAGRHGLIGAATGCLVGRHMAKKHEQEQHQQEQNQTTDQSH